MTNEAPSSEINPEYCTTHRIRRPRCASVWAQRCMQFAKTENTLNDGRVRRASSASREMLKQVSMDQTLLQAQLASYMLLLCQGECNCGNDCLYWCVFPSPPPPLHPPVMQVYLLVPGRPSLLPQGRPSPFRTIQHDYTTLLVT